MAAFFESIDSTANRDIQPVVDDVLTIVNNHFIVRDPHDIVAMMAMSATLARVRFTLPSIRSITTPFLLPVEGAVTPGDLPAIVDYTRHPFRWSPDEELAIEATSAIVMGSENFTALIAIRRQFQSAPVGPIFTLRGTGTTTQVANAWTTVAITFQDTPERGRYAIVGLETQGATNQAGRLIIPGQEMRPGCVGQTALLNNSGDLFKNGNLGVWGHFDPYVMPQVQMLSNAADAAQEVYLQFVKVA